ncbi:hypothetical protein MNBD_PLANCTO03-413 [hydrothermal vent metagenome]|uniref:Uncharacterized protein n=1 Tax=hydrothermal vent metagenome TaxID=652676 RepID=A0A3B1DZM9_9ZZZZ
MKRILTAFSVLAIINLLGIVGAVGWLAATQRLSTERIEAVREILHEPVPVELARLEAEQKAAEAEAGPIEEPLPETPPLGADELVSLQQEEARAEEFRVQRRERENASLAMTTTLELRRLDKEREEFEAERDRFERQQANIAALRGDQQFQAALSVLVAVKPADAKAMLQEIIDGRAGAIGVGDAPGMSGQDRAVAYLDSMDERIRGKVMAEFVKDSPTLAADLLERLRTFGLLADASGETMP